MIAPAHPPPANASATERVRYLRDFIRPYAQTIAAWHLVGEEDEPEQHQRDILLAAIGHAERHKLGRAEAVMAGEAEWAAGIENARQFLAAMRSRIWPLGRGGAAGAAIVAEARALNDRFGWVLPTPLLLQEASRIAHAAAPAPARRFRRYG